MQRNRFGSRRTAKYAENADVHGRVREARFDLDPEPPQYRPAAHESALSVFEALQQAEQDQLTGFVVASISKATPLESRSRSPFLGESRSRKTCSDTDFAHFWDRVAVIYDAASYFLTGSLAPYDGGPAQNVIAASILARQASQDLGQPITKAEIAGACLALDFETVTSPRTGRGLLICAVWKDS